MMQEERVKEEEEVLVTFDVTSLFTNVPTDEAVDVMHRKLAAERIAELLQLFLKSTYFRYNGEFYKQMQGAAMGSL